jgi:hypothetical protein
MDINYYYYEKQNREIHDDVREFCLCERVNEEYLRTNIKKYGLLGKIKIVFRNLTFRKPQSLICDKSIEKAECFLQKE